MTETPQQAMQAIREALEKGPTPGARTCFHKHKYDEWHVGMPLQGQSMKLALFPDGCPTERPEADSALIAACHPERIRALIEHVEALEAENERLQIVHQEHAAELGEEIEALERKVRAHKYGLAGQEQKP